MQYKRKKPAAFLDRDGVINYERGYVSKFDQIKFRKGVLRGLKFLTKKNFYIFIVTNQAGIAKGFIKKKEFIKLNKNFINFFSKRKIRVTEIKYCPHHPNGIIKMLKKKCKCRKPGNLLIKQLFKKWSINKTNSFMIGDRKKDKVAATKSGLRFAYAKNDFNLQVRQILKDLSL